MKEKGYLDKNLGGPESYRFMLRQVAEWGWDLCSQCLSDDLGNPSVDKCRTILFVLQQMLEDIHEQDMASDVGWEAMFWAERVAEAIEDMLQHELDSRASVR